MLPKIMCDCLGVNLIVLCLQDGGSFNYVCMEPDTTLLSPLPPAISTTAASCPKLILLKARDHYDAIQPTVKNSEVGTDFSIKKTHLHSDTIKEPGPICGKQSQPPADMQIFLKQSDDSNPQRTPKYF